MKSVLSFSGGKDSGAMLVHMYEQGIKVDEIVYADVEKSFPQEIDYVKKIEKHIGQEIIILKSGDWNKWFFGRSTRGKSKGEQRGWPLTFFACWHSREAKFKPLDSFCRGKKRYIGYAVDEKAAKRQKIIREYRKNNYLDGYSLPLIDWGWTELECGSFLEERGLLNPLYEHFDRLGCYLCPKQSEKALRTIYRHFPDQWKELKWYDERTENCFSPKIPCSIVELEDIFKNRSTIKAYVESLDQHRLPGLNKPVDSKTQVS